MTAADPARLDEFRRQRFGMFIHWGVYALAARHEWVRNRERLSRDQYQPYLDRFDPDLFDPAVWARAARDAGMTYMVLTTKHHDGFCLWDSELTDYSVRSTPWGKDLVGPTADAFRREGLGVGFYHSLLDWQQPDFPIDGLHPDFERDGVDQHGRDVAHYAQYLHGQVEELLTKYAPVDTMWFDFSYRNWRDAQGRPLVGGKGAADWRSDDLISLVRRLAPQALINDRLDVDGSADFVTPEQYQPVAPVVIDGVPVTWEACQTLNGSWGYDRDNLDWKSPELLIKLLVDTVSKDGNLLLNVGPNGRGELEPRALDTLAEIGRWMRLHARSIHGAGASAFAPPRDCRYTQRGDRLYLHVFSWPFRHLHLPGLAGKVRYAQLLNDASEVRRVSHDEGAVTHPALGTTPDDLTIELPIQHPDVAVPVVELFLHE
ncbi:alpha-L-fucosidase [Jiangella alba]|uniref:alpha-L-fucosidase n=1 Tax=Jiangella alba TaxID=561176 RepID=A0A1H5LDR9_9ACTN|nr:alpha-L-fucosidase [Jiangella alba]SEE74707.1 alpha-L-fucosidase [Jiangella alba]